MARYIIDNQETPIDFEIKSDQKITRTLQNAKNLLMTHMGEVPYDRFRGFDQALFHLPLDEMQAHLLPELDRLMLYEPDVTVVSATVRQGPTPDSEPIITVTLDVGINE